MLRTDINSIYIWERKQSYNHQSLTLARRIARLQLARTKMLYGIGLRWTPPRRSRHRDRHPTHAVHTGNVRHPCRFGHRGKQIQGRDKTLRFVGKYLSFGRHLVIT